MKNRKHYASKVISCFAGGGKVEATPSTKTKQYSGRSGASGTSSPVLGQKGFKEAPTPKGYRVPAITVRSGKEESTVMTKPERTGQTFLTSQANNRWINAGKGTIK